jgi:hypothetical protein
VGCGLGGWVGDELGIGPVEEFGICYLFSEKKE